MYLKEISVSGFKSFADKLTINLDDKITCIVGPNGSGKSNVVDAVRWVLGEQSVKSLRGNGSMSDVIFSGSKTRKALNVASVTLVFDNSDNYLKVPYTEVSVKRRVYRTGENEYFLNGEKCRLKDVLDLFMDSGVGRESFNIISQGEVQKILSNSPVDRRVIFEEAAGVLKYKKRKEEAIRKIERTEDNLNRVNDIIMELELQVNPLREQSKKALEYLENKKGLDKYEVALITHDIEEMNYSYVKNKERIDKLNEQIVSNSINSNNNDVLITSLKEEINSKEQELNDLNYSLLITTREKEKLNGEKNMFKERSKYDASNDLVHENIRNLKEEKLKLETEIDISNQKLVGLNSNLTLKNETVNGLNKELEALKYKKDNLLKELDFKSRNSINLKHKIELTTNFIENGGNLPNSVKSILNNPRLTGVHDTLGNLLNIKEKYIKALDVAILSSKFFIIVDNEKAAGNAIYYLKNNNLGRATFFPLSVIKPKGIDYETMEILRSESGFIDVLANLVEYDNKYRNIILNQLGNVIVSKTLEDGNRISKNINGRYKIVTLDGDVIHVGGSMTGGTLNVSKSLASERIELEHLQKDLTGLEEATKEIEDSLANLTNDIRIFEEKIYKVTSEKVILDEEIKTKNNYVTNLKDTLDSTLVELSNLGNVIDNSISKEEELLLEKYYNKVKEHEEISNKIKLITKDIALKRSNLEELEAKYKLNNTNLHKQEKEVKELEIEVNRMDVKLDNLLNILSEEYSLTFEKAREEYVLDIEVEDAREKVNLYKNNIKKLGMVNLASIDEYERVNTRYEFLTKQKDDLLNAKETLLEIIKEMDEVMKSEFSKTFEAIEKEFKEVFRELFGGGNATLKLTNPDDVLETGIEIIASPPGKKLTTISLLSGGEKTLTAISLLFAILNIRVVPFCLFDEVEAALDEANVDNFGHYLDHYKLKTQFLLITHKKKTMEYANTLYGITMQESGVSKLVSVKLDENK